MAGFSNLYPNLPGMLVEFKDGGLALRSDPNPPTTDSMLILGTAMDGPVMEPIAVDANTAELLFGKDVKTNGVPNGSTLIPAFKQAWDSGCRDIRLMRVTGSAGKATIKTADETISEQVRATENLGVCEGGDETVVTLAHKPIVRNSVKILSKGVVISTGYLVNESAGKITINAGACDAGANLTVSYSYNEVKPVVAEEHDIDGDLSCKLDLDPMPGTVVVKYAGVIVPNIYVTVTGNVVKVTSYNSSTTANSGETISVDYDGITKTAYTSTETGAGSVPFKTETSLMVKKLLHTPVADSVHVYVNDAEVLTAGAFTVDVGAKTVSIKKELFEKGATVTASYYHDTTYVLTRTVDISSMFGGQVYGEAKVEVTDLRDSANGIIPGKLIRLTKPESKKAQVADAPLTYSSDKYPTFGQLVAAINQDLNNGLFKAKTDYPGISTALLENVEANLTGAEDGITSDRDTLFKALSGTRNAEGYLVTQGAYQLLEDYQVDWVVPVGVYADEQLAGRYDSFAYELALFCAVLSYRNKTTLAGISMIPCNDTGLSGIQDYAKYLASYNNSYLMRDAAGNSIKDSDGNAIDLGKFLSVVAGPQPTYYDSTLGLYDGDAAISYIAMNTVLMPQSAPTNKIVPSARGLKFRFSNAQLDAITGNKLVTYKMKAKNGNEGVYVIDGVTAARPGSDYIRLTTSKVVREVCDQIRDVCDPFLGEGSTVEQQNAMASTISKRLGLLKEKGVILDYSFQIIASAMDVVLGQAKIELSLVPPQELRRITTVVGLKNSI